MIRRLSVWLNKQKMSHQFSDTSIGDVSFEFTKEELIVTADDGAEHHFPKHGIERMTYK